MLLTFQTTSGGVDDSTLDALTLVLLVGFVVSLVALSLLLARRHQEPPSEQKSLPDSEPVRPLVPTPAPRPRSEFPATVSPDPATPAWLSGVTLPRTAAPLSEATATIECLLEARRSQNLTAGIALYSPSFRARLANELGVPIDGLDGALEVAAIDGEPPVLRSVELMSATGNSMSIRAGYSDRSAEVYRLANIDGRWLIDSIERG